MKILLFGATGMVGQGVLREALLDPEIDEVLCVGRASIGEKAPKVREVVCADLYDLAAIADQLAGYDACLFCLGVSAAGMSEAEYRKVTLDLTLSVAKVLSSPTLRFLYVSGAGTKGRAMWARVKGETEDALLAMPFRSAHMFRPAVIRPLHGIRSKTRLYRALYAAMAPFGAALERSAPRYVTTTERVGRAMLHVAKHGHDKQVLENDDVNALGALG